MTAPAPSPSWLPALPPGIALRREAPGDRDFAQRLYAANRMAELALLPWPPQAKADFLAQQFAAQSSHLARAWPRADRFVIEEASTAIGRLYLGRRRDCWHLIEIGLMPAKQRRGLGTALIAALQAGTVTAGVPVLDLEVARDNGRAAALYARLGFAEVASGSATHRTMAWRGPAPAPFYPATHGAAGARG